MHRKLCLIGQESDSAVIRVDRRLLFPAGSQKKKYVSYADSTPGYLKLRPNCAKETILKAKKKKLVLTTNEANITINDK